MAPPLAPPSPSRSGQGKASAGDRWKRLTVVTNVASTAKQLTEGAKPTTGSAPSEQRDIRPSLHPDDERFESLSKKFFERVKEGTRGAKLEGELRNFVKDVQSSLRLDDVSRDESRDRALVQSVRRACEATVQKCFQEHSKEQLELYKVQSEYFSLQQQNREMQRKRVMENVGMRDKVRKPDETHVTGDDTVDIPELNSLPEDARELCETAINERVRQILERPNKVLLNAINKFLETEDIPDSWSGKVPEAPTASPQSPRSMAALLRPPRPLANLKNADHQKIKDLEKQIHDLESELSKVRNDTKGINDEKDKLTNELESSRASFSEDLQMLRDQLKLARGDMHDKIIWLEKQVKEEKDPKKEKEVEKLRKDKAKLKKDIEETNEREKKYSQQADHLMVKILEAQGKLDAMMDEEKKGKQELTSLMDERDRRKVLLNGLANDVSNVENTTQELLQMQKDGLRFNEHGEVYSITRRPPKQERKRSSGLLPQVEDDPKKLSPAELKKQEAERQAALEREKKRKAQQRLLKNLIKVLESQKRLSTPDGQKSRDWGDPLSGNALVGPADDGRVVQLLSKAKREGILDFDGDGYSANNSPEDFDDNDKSRTPSALNVRKNVPPAMQGRIKHATRHGQRFSPASSKQDFYVLSPDTDDHSQEKMRLSQSCTDLGVKKRKEAMGLTW